MLVDTDREVTLYESENSAEGTSEGYRTSSENIVDYLDEHYAYTTEYTLMVTIVSGLVGGFVATIVMTIFMMALGDDSPPPTAVFWSQYLGDGEPDQYMMQGMVLHFIYGIIAGGVFAILVPALGLSVATLGAAVLWGLVYGVVLFVIGAAFWMMMVMGMSPEMEMAGMFLFFHLVYGLVLGLWVGYGILG